MSRLLTCLLAVTWAASAAAPPPPDLAWPPTLPDTAKVLTDRDPAFLRPPAKLKLTGQIAKTVPTIDFLYYDCQTYPGNPWSVWGDSLAVNGKYYSAIGDHIGPAGNAFVYEYDPATKALRLLVDVRKALNMPDGHYTPGKIHSRIDLGKDGYLYFSTHRGSTRVTIPKYHYKGDWILRHHIAMNKTEIVAHAPLPNQCLPASILDPERLIYYAGTADGDRTNKTVQFLAYDVPNKKVLYHNDDGPARYMIHARSSGLLYYLPKRPAERGQPAKGKLLRFDPTKPGAPVPINAEVGLRTATLESSNHKVYTVDRDNLWEFDTKTETARHLGGLVVGEQTYITSIDLDPKTERYLYFVAGAHGGGERDGSPLVQYDLKTNTRKVIAFLHPFYHKRCGFVPLGTFGSAVSADGSKVYVTWNGNRGTPADKLNDKRLAFNTCAMTVIHVPAEERQP